MNNNYNTAVFFTYGMCNLKCKYCNIDKNPALKEIDNKLKESFETDYYFNQLKKYFPNRGQLTSIETWGGEPFMGMHRIYNLLHQIIDYYPYFQNMYSSTNFSYKNWCDEVFGLFNQFKDYSYKDFNFCLQLSCDGPDYINDTNRGQGTTKACLENFQKFISLLKNKVPSNLNLTITLKPTLDLPSIYKLCNKEKIIEYYQFFEENFIYPIHQLNCSNINTQLSIPNTAVPSPATQEDGKIFATLCKLCREIEKENEINHYFEYYNDITPFSMTNNENILTYKYNCHTCGTGSSFLCFLPDNMISSCHEGFTDFVNQYTKYLSESKRNETGTILFNKFANEKKLSLCLTEEQYKDHEQRMSYFNVENATARLGTLTTQIITLAMAHQIDSKFIDQKEALKAGIFIQSHIPFCIKDNINMCGSLGCTSNGELKLLLNGAMEYIQKEEINWIENI